MKVSLLVVKSFITTFIDQVFAAWSKPEFVQHLDLSNATACDVTDVAHIDKNNKIATTKVVIAISALLLGVIGLGFVSILVRLSSMGPYAIGFWRLTLALPFLMAMMFINHQSRQDSSLLVKSLFWKDYAWILFSGILFGMDLAVWHLSIKYTTIANAAVLCNLAPLLVALWGWLVLKHGMNIKLLLGLMMAFLGVVVLINPRFSSNHHHLWGDFFGVLTAVFYAGYLLLAIRARKTVDTLRFMAIACIAGAVTLFIFNWFSGDSLLIPTLTEFYILLGLAFISQVLGQGLIAYAFAYLRPSFSSATLLIEPVIATIIAWLLFSETLSLIQMIGIAITLTGIYLTKPSLVECCIKLDY
jgi:drug/metabolite transporter (DMT)-like permease